MPGVVWKTWEPIDESLKQSGVIQRTAEKISRYLSGLSREVVKVSSRRWLLDRSSLVRGGSLFEAA